MQAKIAKNELNKETTSTELERLEDREAAWAGFK